ncbi:pentapeptide repeat-containing protein [Microbacterium fluvii]|uniref:Pentapeptide repeat-containing protein n=1 Tax=Microbacterium fluvii TaxID=415215 RepID=A0ABW2HCY1_9MICO|nr:pentapeptide repeat-containing protein [Microbacterium fluvii]MCU4672747.1 pentapeptide repeat-containing protein [Microbacterium fluvii]
MASPRSRKAAGPQAPLFDFDDGVLDDLPPGDEEALDDGPLDGVAYRDLVRGDWVIRAGDVIDGCRFDGVRASAWTIRGARLAETSIRRADIPVVSAARSDARDLIVSDSRLGSVDAFDASWRCVRFVRCRLGFLNLRGASLTDVAFDDCTIDELDLLDAKAHRVAFTSTTLGSLTVAGATLTDVDLRGAEIREIVGLAGLRGATISDDQLRQMAPAFADLAGIEVL